LVSDNPEIFIIDSHAIFRMGMVAYLSSLPTVGGVTGCSSCTEAWLAPELAMAELVLLDLAIGNIEMAIGQLLHRAGCPVMAMTQSWETARVLEAVEAGAVGVLCKDDLTAEGLGTQVRAALQGAGVIPPRLLETLLARRSDGDSATSGATGGPGLTVREQRVLRLIADGKLTREVASELAYSERTVKTVLRDAVVKLGARSRSQAVASAVRHGLI
jgi:DNA-binding NarL/FixJ family response regulator